jgi:hypothetical protein
MRAPTMVDGSEHFMYHNQNSSKWYGSVFPLASAEKRQRQVCLVSQIHVMCIYMHDIYIYINPQVCLSVCLSRVYSSLPLSLPLSLSLSLPLPLSLSRSLFVFLHVCLTKVAATCVCLALGCGWNHVRWAHLLPQTFSRYFLYSHNTQTHIVAGKGQGKWLHVWAHLLPQALLQVFPERITVY